MLLVIEALLLFVVTPLASIGWLPRSSCRRTFILLVLATLVVTSRSHLAAGMVLISAILSSSALFVHVEDPSVLTEWLSAGGRLLAIATLSVVIARAVFAPGQVTRHRIEGAIVLYMNFALFFSILYQLINVLVANAFAGLPSAAASTAPARRCSISASAR